MSRFAMVVDIEPIVDPSAPVLRLQPGVKRGKTGEAYRANANAEAGTPPYTYTALTSLPAWATLNTSTGEITGTPSGGPAYTEVEIEVEDALGATATIVVAIDVIDAIVIGGVLAPAEEGIAYSSGLTVSGETGTVTWGMTGSIPGLSIDSSTGVISGTPTTAGKYNVTIDVADSAGESAIPITFEVAEPLDLQWPAAPTSALIGAYVEIAPTITGGVRPFLFEVDPGNPLPAGLSLNPATGLIFGTPSAEFSGSSIVTVSDLVGGSDTENALIYVNRIYRDYARAVVATFAANVTDTQYTVNHTFEENGVLSVQVTKRIASPLRHSAESVDFEWNDAGGAVVITFQNPPGFVTFDVVMIGNRGT